MESHDSAPPRRDERLLRRGWWLTGIGLAVIVASVLQVTSAAYGTHPLGAFSERRSYNMIKRDVHSAFPLALLQGLCGLGLVIAGARWRKRAFAGNADAAAEG